MCRDERWAHDAALFKTGTAAVALLEVTCEGPVFERKREHWLKWKLERTSKILSQMIVDTMADGPAVRPYLEIFPGLKTFLGSNARLISRITSSN